MVKLILFEVSGHAMALPADTVQKLVDPVPVTPLPFVPHHIEGLAAVGGTIVAQIDLSRRHGFPSQPSGSASEAVTPQLMLVKIKTRLMALRVNRVLATLDLDKELIAAPNDAPGLPVADLAEGAFHWQDRWVPLLRLDRVGLDELKPRLPRRPVAILGETDTQRSQETSATVQHLVVRCCEERYALPLHLASEVVTVERLAVPPRAPPEVTGIALVRGVPLLVLSLCRMLGHGTACAAGPRVPLVLVHHNGRRFALAVDAVLGMERFDAAGLSPFSGGGGIAGYYASPDKTRRAAVAKPGQAVVAAPDCGLVGLVDPDGLVDESLFRFAPAPPGGDGAARGEETLRSFLTFQIGGELYGIDLGRVERVAEHRPPHPLLRGQHAGLVGVVEIGGRVVPVADIRARPAAPTRRTAYVLARGRNGPWALTVDRLARIVRIPTSAIKAAGTGPHFVGEIARLGQHLVSILDPLAFDLKIVN